MSGGEKWMKSFGQSCPSVINPASRVPRLSGGVVGARQRDVDCVSSLQNKSKPCRKRVHLVQTWKSHPSGRSWTQLKVSVLCFDLVSDWLWACERLYGCNHSGFLWVRPAQTLQVYGHILLLVSCFCVYFSNIKWNNNPVISRSASVSFSFLCLFLNFIYALFFYWWMFTENGQSFRTNVGVCKGDLCERRAQTSELFFLSLDLYDVSERRYSLYGHLSLSVQALSTEAQLAMLIHLTTGTEREN